MAMARIDMRLDEEIKAKAEKASALLGMKSLTEYLTHLMNEDASKVIAEHEKITLKADVFDQFISACDNTKKPNKALKDTAAFARKSGFK